MVTQLAGIAVANFCYIGLKAFQQLNVVHHDLKMVVIGSNLLAMVEVYLIASYAQHGPTLPVVLTVGMSGALGCIVAMVLRKKYLS